MKTKHFELTDAQKTHLDRIYEDLGPDLMKKLHKAFTLTAAAFHKRAKQRAEAEMQMADQYRTYRNKPNKQEDHDQSTTRTMEH